MNRSSLIVLGFTLIFAVVILQGARSRRTAERHTIAWLLVCAATAFLAIWREGIDALAMGMGIHYPPSAMFFVACTALVWLVYRLSLQVNEQKQQIKVLAQEISLLNALHPREAREASSIEERSA